jgi:hypothetical protein
MPSLTTVTRVATEPPPPTTTEFLTISPTYGRRYLQEYRRWLSIEGSRALGVKNSRSSLGPHKCAGRGSSDGLEPNVTPLDLIPNDCDSTRGINRAASPPIAIYSLTHCTTPVHALECEIASPTSKNAPQAENTQAYQ